MRNPINLLIALIFGLCALAVQADDADAEISVYEAIQFAKPDNFPLTLDIYVPKTGKKSYPVLVIYHGGGWLLNNNSIMNDMATKIARDGDMVVANMNYRLLVDQGNTVTISPTNFPPNDKFDVRMNWMGTRGFELKQICREHRKSLQSGHLRLYLVTRVRHRSL